MTAQGQSRDGKPVNQHQLQNPFHLRRKWPLSPAGSTGPQGGSQMQGRGGAGCHGENTQGLSISEGGCAGRAGEAFDPELENSDTQRGSEGIHMFSLRVWVLTPGLKPSRPLLRS